MKTRLVTLGLVTLLFFLLIGAVCGQSQPDWIYEWNADETPQPGPDFTFRGVLILKKEGSSLISRPSDGATYQVGDIIGDGEVGYKGLGDPVAIGSYIFGSVWSEDGLVKGQTYYYKLFSYDEIPAYSSGIEIFSIAGVTTPTPYPYHTPAPKSEVKLSSFRRACAPAPRSTKLSPPDVTKVSAGAYGDSVYVWWTNPRDLVGWGCYGSDCCSVNSGIVTLDTFTSVGGIKSYYSKAADFKTINSYTVEFRMRVIESESSDGRVAFRSVAIRPDSLNGVNTIQLDFSEDLVKWALLTPIEYRMDTTADFHIYRIVGGSIGRLYINNKFIGSGRLSNQNPDYCGVYFGDAIGGGSQSQWDYIRYAYGAYPPITPIPTPSPTPLARGWFIIDRGDYDGNKRSDIAIFRPYEGLWAIKGQTRLYFGTGGDKPASGDYNGDGTADIAVFRGFSGLWAIRGISRTYFGNSFDIPVPGDYDGDGSCDVGIFRGDNGLWAIKNITRFYQGSSDDLPVPGDYDGDGTREVALYNQDDGLWMMRDFTIILFGGGDDRPIPGDYNGDGSLECGIFRPSSGLWAVRGVTRSYFGGSSDQPLPADYSGDGRDDIGIFRNSSGLWAVKGVTRVYFGSSSDTPVTR